MSKPAIFYEVFDNKMNVEFGSASASEAIAWFRRGLDRTITLSIWDEEDPEDFKLITDRIDATPLVLAALTSERARAMVSQ